MPSEGATDTAGDARLVKTVRFRRGRAAKACEVCHARKVRCDMTEKFPCTNCRAFSLVCVPRTGRSKGRKPEQHSGSEEDTPTRPHETVGNALKEETLAAALAASTSVPSDGSSAEAAAAAEVMSNAISAEHSNSHINGNSLQKREPSRFMKTLRDSLSTGGELPEDGLLAQILRTRFKIVSLPHYDADVVAARVTGCFLLPTNEIADHLVETYFKYVHPLVPVVNRIEFMKQYRENRDKPPLLLRHAMFCLATKHSTHPDLLDEHDSPRKAAYAFYRRAKMLIDIGFEETVEISTCAAIILSLAIENPLFMNQNGYYWVRVALSQAQGMRMHRRLRNHESPPEQRRRYRRIWWSLYKRDVATAVAFGAPLAINLDDCDVEMVCAEDFVDSEGTDIEPGSDVDVHINYFIQSVRLHEILALIIRVQLSAGAERLRRLQVLPDATQCDRALAEWVNQLPAVLVYSIKDQRRHYFVRALLYLEYYTVVCLSHRPQVSHLFKVNGWEDFPTWSIAFQAAHMICKIFENFGTHNELRCLPGNVVYSCFCALVMLSFQRRILGDSSPGFGASNSADAATLKAVDNGIKSFVDICREIGKTHATGIWIMHLAVDLKSDDVARKLARSLRAVPTSNMAKRRRTSPDQPRVPPPSGLILATDPLNAAHDDSSPLSQSSMISPASSSVAVQPGQPLLSTQMQQDQPQDPSQDAQPQDQPLQDPLQDQSQSSVQTESLTESPTPVTPQVQSQSQPQPHLQPELPQTSQNYSGASSVSESGSIDPKATIKNNGVATDDATTTDNVMADFADSPIKRAESVAAMDFFPQESFPGDFFSDPKGGISLSSMTDEIPNMIDWVDFLSTGSALDSSMGPML